MKHFYQKILFSTGYTLLAMYLLGCRSEVKIFPIVTLSSPTSITSQPPSMTSQTQMPNEFQWEAKPVLVEMYDLPSVIEYSVDRLSVLPTFILYSDGNVFKVTSDYEDTYHKTLIYQGMLSRGEVCEFLIPFEKFGFFSFPQNDYIAPSATDQGTTLIRIKTWQENTISAYALRLFDFDLGTYQFPEQILASFKHIEEYSLDNLSLYTPNQIILEISSDFTDNRQFAKEWDFDAVPLAQLAYKDPTKIKFVQLQGQIAHEIWIWSENMLSRFVVENEQTYYVTIRPLLPKEIPFIQDTQKTSVFPQIPTQRMTCP